MKQLEQNEYFCSLNYYAILTQWYNRYNFFSDNVTIISWMKETNSCFFRTASKASLRIQQNLYTIFEWIWQSNLQNFIFSWRVLREKMKIKVSNVYILTFIPSYKMEMQKIWRVQLSPPKKNYTIAIFKSTLRLEIIFREMTVSTSCTCHHTIITETIILRPHLDPRWFFLYSLVKLHIFQIKKFLKHDLKKYHGRKHS